MLTFRCLWKVNRAPRSSATAQNRTAPSGDLGPLPVHRRVLLHCSSTHDLCNASLTLHAIGVRTCTAILHSHLSLSRSGTSQHSGIEVECMPLSICVHSTCEGYIEISLSLSLHLPWQMISYMHIRLPRMDECRLLFLYLSILQWTCLSTTHFVPAVHLSSPYTGKCYGAPTFHNSWLSRVRVHDIHILLSSQCFILPLPASAAGPPNTWSMT